jgi:Flp pilus assembly protein TadG
MGRATMRQGTVRSRHLPMADERGVALVEFALVLPLLLVLLLGMIDVGKAVNYWNDETHLANEAARYAAVYKNPGPQSTLNQSILNQADSNELKNGNTTSIPFNDRIKICIWFPTGNFTAGQPVQVVVTAKYHWLGYLVGKGLLPSSTLRATSTMRLEQSYTTGAGALYTTGASNATDGSGTC